MSNHTGNVGAMWFRTGVINANGTITWSASQSYDGAVNPRVTLVTDGTHTWAVEVHQQGTTPGRLWAHTWTFTTQPGTPPVAQSVGSWQYDSGINPAIGAHGYNVLEVHQGGSGLGQLWYHQGSVQNGSPGFFPSAYPYAGGAETPAIAATTDSFAIIAVHHTGAAPSLQQTAFIMP